jgi:hypothetical protein
MQYVVASELCKCVNGVQILLIILTIGSVVNLVHFSTQINHEVEPELLVLHVSIAAQFFKHIRVDNKNSAHHTVFI